MPAAPVDAQAVLALLALLLLPGLVIVRSPWPFVPFLSIAFWLVGWLVTAQGGRSAFLVSWLGISMLLVLLRLPRLPSRLWPRWPSLVIAVAAVVEIVPFLLWAVPPGTDAAFLALESRILWGAEGIAPSDGPLGAIGRLVPAQFGVAALAADISLLSGVATERAVLLVSLAGRGLFTIALYALSRRLLGDRAGAGVALVAMALSRIPLLAATGGESVFLSGALALASFALLIRGVGRSGAVAAGFFLAGALVADPGMAALGSLALGGLAFADHLGRRGRALLALWVSGAGLVAFIGRWFVALPRAGLVDALPLSLADTGRWVATGAVLGGATLALVLRRRGPTLVGLVIVTAALPGLEAHARGGRVLLDRARVHEWRAATERMTPLVPVCGGTMGLDRVWVPAVTGHPLSPPWGPAWLGETRTGTIAACLSVPSGFAGSDFTDPVGTRNGVPGNSVKETGGSERQ